MIFPNLFQVSTSEYAVGSYLLVLVSTSTAPHKGGEPYSLLTYTRQGLCLLRMQVSTSFGLLKLFFVLTWNSSVNRATRFSVNTVINNGRYRRCRLHTVFQAMRGSAF